jgi:DNA-binding transcriptional ArsR family regulator
MSLRTGQAASGAVVELEFAFDSPEYPFVGASAAGDCKIELEEMVPRGEDAYAEFFSVRGAPPETIERMAAEHATASASTVERYDDGALMEFVVTGDCPAVGLAELGALPRSVVGENGEGQIVAELPAEYDPADVVDAFQSEYGGDLVAKREHATSTPLFSHRELDREVDRRLTGRQREVLEAAFEAGYYDWPREISSEELAEELGISQPTLSEHLTAAERKLLTLLFDG